MTQTPSPKRDRRNVGAKVWRGMLGDAVFWIHAVVISLTNTLKLRLSAEDQSTRSAVGTQQLDGFWWVTKATATPE